MFVLQAKSGAKLTYNWRANERDISGRYFRHTCSNTEGWWTDDLQKAKVYNTEAGAKRNWDADLCEVVAVKVELA
jgi:hypothetical protein